MTDMTQCLTVDLLYNNIVNEFDELLSQQRMTYLKTYFHSFVYGLCYKFIIFSYSENEKITSFLSGIDDVLSKRFIKLTDSQFENLKDIILK